MEQNTINFHCPEFNFGILFYEQLIDLENRHPEYFNPEARIGTIFGSFPNMIWNGGGILTGSYVSISDMERIRDFYYNLEIPLQLTLTNPLLTKEDCYDRYCNKVVEVFQNDLNMILVSSSILEEYLREKYPNYKYCKSIIASEKDYNFEEALNNYEYVVLPRRKCKDFDYLNTVKQENRSRLELLCNDPCPINCPRLYSHYRDFAKITLYEKDISDKSLTCSEIDSTCLRGIHHIDEQILFKDIKEKYLPLGFTEFKLAGRGNFISAAANVIKYFIKEEYQYEALVYFITNNF